MTDPVPPSPAPNDESKPPTEITVDLAAPENYIQRELSLLEFQRRVLAQALDADVPLLERLRFLTITATNLDEFFEIRVAGLKQKIRYAASGRDSTGRTYDEVLTAVTAKAKRLVKEQYRVLNDELFPAFENAGIRILRRELWNDSQLHWVHRHFLTQVLPILSPIGLDPAHPFPKTLGKSLNFIVELEGQDGFGREIPMAIVQVPRSLPRVIALPKSQTDGYQGFVLLSSVIHAHITELFRGLTVLGCHQFRITRDSDLLVDAEEMKDLMKTIRGELSSRIFSTAVRLEIAASCPSHIANFLLESFELSSSDTFRVDGPVNLHRLAEIYSLIDEPDLKYTPFVPGTPKRIFKSEENLFDIIRAGDVLLHHPYQSFTPVVEFLDLAAKDPDVLAIKMTLYRTGSDSPIIHALTRAAERGKDVTVVIELRARFDEAVNIDFAKLLQEVGAKVVYGIVGYKTHSKMLMVVRREAGGLQHYVHMATGNYHAGTARLYTDFCLMTADPVIGQDVQRLFLQLTGTGEKVRLKKLLSSPFRLHKALLRLIDGEAEAARAGKPAHIRFKVNSINDAKIIRALYRASQAGVQIDLIIRGVCCIRPGVPGVSENIRVRSIVGRFLEHSRAFNFHAGGEELVYLGSADLLGRNLHGRVEVVFPIENERHKKRVLREAFTQHLEDTDDSWSLRSDGTWRRSLAPRDHERSSQTKLLGKLSR